MQGQKYNDDIKEKAIALLTVNNSVSFVARELGLPRSTVKTWQEQYNKQAAENGEDDIAKLREKNKEMFVKQAWDNIKLASDILARKLQRAAIKEELLDSMLEEALKETAGADRRKQLANNIANMKLEDISKLTTALGTLYDKQALASNEATVREEQIIKKFEDF